MKKCILFLFLLVSCFSFAQKKTKDYSNILRSTNIYEINAFLRDAHPDDPKRSVLKPKVMKMMKEYIREAKEGDQKVKQMQEMLALLRSRPSTKISFDEMNAIIKRKQIQKMQAELARMGKINTQQATPIAPFGYTYKASPSTYQEPSTGAPTAFVNTEEDEFKMLMQVNPVEHKNKTVQLLNSLFDNDPNAKDVIVMIENKSDCNIIVRMEGRGTSNFRLAIPMHTENSIVIPKGDYLFTSLVCGAQYASQKTVQKALMVALGNPAALAQKAK